MMRHSNLVGYARKQHRAKPQGAVAALN